MKKIIITLVLFLTISTALVAQPAEGGVRPYTKDEMTRWAKVCSGMAAAIPATFATWKVNRKDCEDFLAWTEVKDGKPLTVFDKSNRPIGNIPNYDITFTCDNEDSISLEEQKLQLALVNDMQEHDNKINPALMNETTAKTTKLLRGAKLSVYAVANQRVDVEFQYHITTKPIKLELPVKAFAYLYTVPFGKQILNENGDLIGGNDDFYLDKAIIIIGSTAPKVVPVPPDERSTYRSEKIFFTDNAPYVSTAPVKNIMVKITGNEKEVRTLIGQIDWKALQSLIGK